MDQTCKINLVNFTEQYTHVAMCDMPQRNATRHDINYSKFKVIFNLSVVPVKGLP